jgi:hypothetical protein
MERQAPILTFPPLGCQTIRQDAAARRFGPSAPPQDDPFEIVQSSVWGLSGSFISGSSLRTRRPTRRSATWRRWKTRKINKAPARTPHPASRPAQHGCPKRRPNPRPAAHKPGGEQQDHPLARHCGPRRALPVPAGNPKQVEDDVEPGGDDAAGQKPWPLDPDGHHRVSEGVVEVNEERGDGQDSQDPDRLGEPGADEVENEVGCQDHHRPARQRSQKRHVTDRLAVDVAEGGPPPPPRAGSIARPARGPASSSSGPSQERHIDKAVCRRVLANRLAVPEASPAWADRP